MSYNKPIRRPVPLGQLCDSGCGQPALYWFKSTKKWCCSETANACPVKKKENTIKRDKRNELKAKFSRIDLDYVKALYPAVHEVDVLEGNLIYNEERGVLQARCTYKDCPDEWYDIPLNHIGFRKWALTEKENGATNGGDGYKFYCSNECRKNCFAHGKTGSTLMKDIKAMSMIDWEEEEWVGSDATQAQKDLWRYTCLERDEFSCQRCGEPVEHVHHITPRKMVPHWECDPVNGISVCMRCHYDHFHQRGTICALNNLGGMVCYPIVNGVPMKPVAPNSISDGILLFN